MPEHDDPQLIERLEATTKQHELEQAATHQIGKRPEHEPAPRNQRDKPTTLRPTRTSHAANRVNAPLTAFCATRVGSGLAEALAQSDALVANAKIRA
jgi:hypothetical protein